MITTRYRGSDRSSYLLFKKDADDLWKSYYSGHAILLYSSLKSSIERIEYFIKKGK